MASDAVDVATGITIAFGTSGFSANVLDIDGPDWAREYLETSHQGTTGGHKTWIGADLADGGEFTFTVQFNPDTDVTGYGGGAEEVTLTWPSTATWVFDAIIGGYTPTAPLNQIMTANVTTKVSGGIAVTAAS